MHTPHGNVASACALERLIYRELHVLRIRTVCRVFSGANISHRTGEDDRHASICLTWVVDGEAGTSPSTSRTDCDRQQNAPCPHASIGHREAKQSRITLVPMKTEGSTEGCGCWENRASFGCTEATDCARIYPKRLRLYRLPPTETQGFAQVSRFRRLMLNPVELRGRF